METLRDYCHCILHDGQSALVPACGVRGYENLQQAIRMADDQPANRVIAISSSSNEPTNNLVLAQPSTWLHAAADSTADVQGHLCFEIACMHT